jgi:hypothetical protein
MDDRKTRPDFNEIAKNFTSSMEMQIKSNQLDLDISIKAAPKTKKAKPKKAPRKKLGKAIWSVGGVRINKNRRGILGMRFKPYVTAQELRSQSGKPNIGWVNAPIGLSPEETKKHLARIHFGDGKQKINLKYRDIKADPRTGSISVKSLGDSLDEIQPLAGVGVRAAARSGVLVDAAGRFRCPPGVPAANQFTDRFGSNCFDITPQNKRRSIEEAVRKAAGLLSDIQIANTVEDSLPEDPSPEAIENAVRELDLPEEQAQNIVEIAARRRAILEEVARIENSAIEQIRKSDPNFTEMTRSPNGITFDNDPLKVAKSAILALQDANPDLDLSGILWAGTGSRAGITPADLEEAIDTHMRAVAGHIWDQLFGETVIGPDGSPVFKDLTKDQLSRKTKMIEYALNFQANTGSTFVGDSGLFNRALAGYIAKEQGFLYGMLDMANTSPELFSKFSQIIALNPDSNESDFSEVEAKAWVDEAGNFVMYWNPMLLMRQGRGYGRPLIADGEYRLFEPADDSADAMESAILDEIANAADSDARRLAINKLFNYKYDKTKSGAGYWGELVDEFGGERAQSMYAVSHEVGHHLTFDIAMDVINNTAVDGEFENVEEALYDVLFGGEVSGLLPDILELFENQATRDVMNLISENGLGGKMPLDYMRELKIFSQLSDAFNKGGVDEMQRVLDSLYSSGLIPDRDVDMWIDRSESLIAGTDKEATQFMKDWKVQQQAVVAELISELRGARQFGLVNATDAAVTRSLRAIDIKEAEIAAGKSARKLAKEAEDSAEDIRGMSSRRLKKIFKVAKKGDYDTTPGWLAGRTPEEMAEALVPDSAKSFYSLMSFSIWKDRNPDKSMIKMMEETVNKELGGIDNIDFSSESVAEMRKRTAQTFRDFPEFARVAQRFGAPPFVTTKDMYSTIIGAEQGVHGFYAPGSRSILINPGIAGTSGQGKGTLGLVARKTGVDRNGWAELAGHVVGDQEDSGFAPTLIHEYAHWLSYMVSFAESGDYSDMKTLLDAGLDEETIKTLIGEHGKSGLFNRENFGYLEDLVYQIYDKEKKLNKKNFQETAQAIFESNDFAKVWSNAEAITRPLSLTKYGLYGGAQENWAEGFTAVVTGKRGIVNAAMQDSVLRLIGQTNDYERSVFSGFNSRRSKEKPAKVSDVKKRSLSRFIKNRNMNEDEIGAVVELEKANEFINNNEPHAALAVLSDEASDGSGQDVLDQTLEKISADGAMPPRDIEKLERLTRAISNSPRGSSTSEIFMNAKQEADRMDSSFQPPVETVKQESVGRSVGEIRGNVPQSRTESILAEAKSMGIEIDSYEKANGEKIIRFSSGSTMDAADWLGDFNAPSTDEEKSAFEKRTGFSFDKRSELLRQFAADGGSEFDAFLKFGSPQDRNSFGARLYFAREIAIGRGDNERVAEIDNFIDEISAMDPEELYAAVNEAARQMDSQFDDRVSVAVSDPLAVINEGRYHTVHDRDSMARTGSRSVSERAGNFDPDSVARIRRGHEQTFLGIDAEDQSEATMRMRPASGYVSGVSTIQGRRQKLKDIYGEDVEIQHDYSLGSDARQIRDNGGFDNRAGLKAYGNSTIVLKPEVSQRSLVFRGDSISDQGTYSPAMRLSTMGGQELQSQYFHPLSVLYQDRTGDSTGVASPSLNTGTPYSEAMVLGSFEPQDIEAIISDPFSMREDGNFGTMNMAGLNPESSLNLTSIISAAKTRDRLSNSGIDAVIDSEYFPLDEVEPFNPSMTRKWVERQIASGKWKDVSPDELIEDETTTPYEALLKYHRSGKANTIFDHPDNEPGNAEKNTQNLVAMIDEELERVESVKQTVVDDVDIQKAAGFPSRRRPLRDVLGKEGFVKETRQQSINHLTSARNTLLSSLGESERAAVIEATKNISSVSIPTTTEQIETMIRNSVYKKKFGKNKDADLTDNKKEIENLINNFIIPFNNVLSRNKLGQSYRTQMNLRVSPENGITLNEGDIIDIPNHFRSDVLSSDSEIMDSAIGFSSRRFIPRDQWVEQQRAGGMQRDANGTYWRMTRSGSWIEWDEPVDDEPYYPQRRRPSVKAPDDATDLIRDARKIDNDFVRSVVGQFDDRGTLTLKQWDALRRTVERSRSKNPEMFTQADKDVLDGLPQAPEEAVPVGTDGSAKVVILAHETDKGIPDVVGDDPSIHTTAITMPPTRLKVEYIGEDGTVYVSVDEQNHVDPVEQMTELIEGVGENLNEAEKTEVAVAKTALQQHQKEKKTRIRGFSSSREKPKSTKTGFEKYQEEAASYRQADDVVSQSEIQPESDKTKRIMQSLESAGAKFAQPLSQEALDAEDRVNFGRVSIPYEKRVALHRKSTFETFDAIRAKSRGEEFFTQEDRVYGGVADSSAQSPQADEDRQWRMKQATNRQISFNNFFSVLPQSVVDHINSRTNEELMEDLKTAALQFNAGIDRRVRVRVKSPYLRRFAESGVYKTTHDEGIRSEHSQSHDRKNAEVQFGIPSSTPDELRPASGYVLHKDSIASVEEHGRSEIAASGDSPILGEFFDWDSYSQSSEFGNRVGVYGGIEIILNDDVAHRTAITGGDSLNGWHNPSMLGETDPERILMSLAAPIHHDSSNMQAQNISLLRSMLEQNYKYTARLEHAKNDIRNIYHEAVIAGSFDASDVSEIRVSHSDMSFHNPETRSQIIDKSIIEALNLSESEMAIVAPFLETFLEKGEASQYRRDSGIMMFPMKDISDLAAHLNHVRMLRQLQEKGFKGRLMRVNRNGVDLMDASLYSGYRPGMTVEQILRGRIVESMKKEIQKLLDSQKSKNKPLERIDF